MNEQINIKRIKNSINRYPELKRILGDINEFTNIYNYPYKQNITIDYEWNILGILNSEDFEDDLINETAKKIKSCEGILELISLSSYLNHISFKKRILERINFLISKLNGTYTDEQIKSGLMNNPFSFLSELEFTNYCIDSSYTIIATEPKLCSGKKLDLRVKIKDESFLIEVITPRLKLSMQQKQSGFFPISAEMENNIKSEFEYHQIEINDIKEKFILVVDGDYAAIDSINIQSALEEFYNQYSQLNHYLSGIFLKRGNQFTFFDSIDAK